MDRASAFAGLAAATKKNGEVGVVVRSVEAWAFYLAASMPLSVHPMIFLYLAPHFHNRARMH
jgi:hypothetical protein